MIYELVFITKADVNDEGISTVKNLIAETFKEYQVETLVNDSWGVKTFAQPFETGHKKGHFFYVMYKGQGTVNAELERKLKINDNVLRYLVVRVGEDREQEKCLKAYRNPNHTQAAGVDEEGEGDKEKRMYSKRRSCYFSAKKQGPDWKDPKSYSWLVNEFGKISPARVTGLTPKYQRKACDAIKRGRMVGLISYISNQIAH